MFVEMQKTENCVPEGMAGLRDAVAYDGSGRAMEPYGMAGVEDAVAYYGSDHAGTSQCCP